MYGWIVDRALFTSVAGPLWWDRWRSHVAGNEFINGRLGDAPVIAVGPERRERRYLRGAVVSLCDDVWWRGDGERATRCLRAAAVTLCGFRW